VNGSGNGISWITLTQGKKGARCSPSPGKYFMHLLIRVLEFIAHKF
jgi:hypothetical protein